ncbi:hypothetical protein EJB05_51341 [Eragrostis curvula]|uniref:Uncharacterized protein n=1 Tax=Eragrostis curvula TaxID=38414 RepID=A0A5J9SVW3_9POAL|nr:hypothetical protein EJB05_51341 [Eragrostis curvula]
MRRRDAARCSSTSASKKRILIRSSSTPATNGDSSVVRSSEELHQVTEMRQLVRAEARQGRGRGCSQAERRLRDAALRASFWLNSRRGRRPLRCRAGGGVAAGEEDHSAHPSSSCGR